MGWDKLSMQEKSELMSLCISNGVNDLGSIKSLYNIYSEGGKLDGKYKVKKGDSIWRIANQNGVSMDEIRAWNPNIKNDLIHPDDVVRVAKPKTRTKIKYVDVNEIRANEERYNRDDLSAIQGYKHNSNYAVLDKKTSKLTVFDPQNRPVYSTDKIATGKSGNDYNTITYTNQSGHILVGKGNESTPAGITEVTGKGVYGGVPSFTRGRYNASKGIYEDIAASIHTGSTAKKKASNGCIRVGAREICELDKHITKGSRVYTLPETEGSKFVLKDGKLNYFADNPYGESEGDKRYWDDYNVHNDKSYKPLLIVDKKGPGENSKENQHAGNRMVFANTVANMKKDFQEQYNIDSDTYNRIAELAMGIAEQETKYGTSNRYALKGDLRKLGVLSGIKAMRGDKNPDNYSRGLTQIKMKGDNQQMQEVYKNLGISESDLEKPDMAAKATMARLIHIYNTEVRGRNFDNEYEKVSPYEALLYKWMGKNAELKNKTATPSQNNYINNVKKYMNDFEYLSGEEEEIIEDD